MFVTQGIFSTLFIFFYITNGFSVLFLQNIIEELEHGHNFVDSLKVIFRAIFGELSEEEDGVLYLNVWLSIILLGSLLSLILSNFLIAIISSKYKELETKSYIITRYNPILTPHTPL